MDNVTKYRCYECHDGYDEDSHECSVCGSDRCGLACSEPNWHCAIAIRCNSCGSWYMEEQECSEYCSAWKEVSNG